jgi:hypothetical protein
VDANFHGHGMDALQLQVRAPPAGGRSSASPLCSSCHEALLADLSHPRAQFGVIDDAGNCVTRKGPNTMTIARSRHLIVYY